MSNNIFTVTDLNNDIKQTLVGNYKLITVVGEVSNFKVTNGTAFFTLKDATSQISVCSFNYSGGNIANGKQVKITGNITIFMKQGTYNISVKSIELIGQGALHEAYNNLKDHYTNIGYFNDDHKKQLKNTITNIGVITSQEGAALQDFIYALNKNNYVGKLYVRHSIVQGKDCPKSVIKNLLEMDKLGLDVIVITRGGGSFEDLFGFSDAGVIDTIYGMDTLVVSAIGHQIDFMLSDFVADIRAPTPSLAAELLSNRQNSLLYYNELLDVENDVKHRIMNKIKIFEDEIKLIEYGVKPNEIIMNNILLDVNKMCEKLNHKIQGKLLGLFNDLGNITMPTQEKYVMVNNKNNNIITCVDDFKSIKKKDEIMVKYGKGYVTFNINNIKYYP